MADTEIAAQAAANPTEPPKPESAVEAKADSKTEDTAAEGSAAKGKSDDAGEEKWELNGKSKERDGRRNDRNDRNGRQDRFDSRRDGGRGRGRGRGGFHHSKRCASCSLLATSD